MSRRGNIVLFLVVLFISVALYLTMSVRNIKEWTGMSVNIKDTINLNTSVVTTSESVISPSGAQKTAVSKSTILKSTILKSTTPTSTVSKSTLPTSITSLSDPTSINPSGIYPSLSSIHPWITRTIPPDTPVDPESLNPTPKKTCFDRLPSQLYHVTKVDCMALFQGDKNALKAATLVKTTVSYALTDEFYMNATTDCDAFKLSRGYIISSLTDEEQNFPIAYSLVVYKDSEMVERLLRAVYRPQNYYCIHVDLKASQSFFKAIAAVAQCFPNVFISTQRISVQWGKFTVLESELICMNELWRYQKWKYFINLTGQEFPLKTNYELVKILEAFHGANNINGTLKYVQASRWRNTRPPLGIRPLKGSVHITANRDFVDYVLHNDTAQAFLEWTNTTLIPDETFFSSLNFNPQLGIKGSFRGDPDSIKTFISRYKNWQLTKDLCAGRFARGICILGLGDLPRLGAAVQLFANKFFLWEDRVVVGCLEEKLFNKTRDDYLGGKIFNASFYGGLNFVTDQVT